ncbi:hypothetical protein Hanom_Chr16g01520441 [Helianthus anomalus]
MGCRATVVAWHGGDGNHIKTGRHKRTREREASEGGGVMMDDGGVPPLMLMSEMMETAAVGSTAEAPPITAVVLCLFPTELTMMLFWIGFRPH